MSTKLDFNPSWETKLDRYITEHQSALRIIYLEFTRMSDVLLEHYPKLESITWNDNATEISINGYWVSGSWRYNHLKKYSETSEHADECADWLFNKTGMSFSELKDIIDCVEGVVGSLPYCCARLLDVPQKEYYRMNRNIGILEVLNEKKILEEGGIPYLGIDRRHEKL
jgi:hypothetical protein